MSNPDGTDRGGLRAVLIGINHWIASGTLRPLFGCVADVELIGDVLRQRFGARDGDVLTLCDEQATKDRILAAIRGHLIAHAEAWRDAGCPQPAPTYLLHYSGHGSRAYAGRVAKMTRYDETIVPHDSRQAGVTDIRDHELGALIDELAAIHDNVTVVLDCCHSGSGLRTVDDLPPRQCPADERPELIAAVDAAIDATRSSDDTSDADAIASPPPFGRPDDWVLLAACQFDQVANEVRVTIDGEERRHGVMSHALACELAMVDPANPPSNRLLWERVSERVRRRKPSQWPQCEGQRDRPLFGAAGQPRDLFLRILKIDGDRITIDGGEVHGLAVGVELDCHPAEANLADESEPIGRIRVTSVDAVRCVCEPAGGEHPIGARLAIDETTATLRPIRIALDDSLGEALQPLIERLRENPVTARCELTDCGDAADVTVCVAGDRVRLIADDGGEFLFDAPRDRPDRIADLVVRRVQWLRALRIGDTARPSRLTGQVSVAVRRAELLADDSFRYSVIEPSAAGEILVEEGRDGIAFEIANRSDSPLYLTALQFGYDGFIQQVLPATIGEHLKVEPGGLARTAGFFVGFHEDDGHLREAVEHVKVFATRSPVDFEMLLRPRDATSERSSAKDATEPGSPLEQLLDEAAIGSGTRYNRPMKAERKAEDWATATASFRMVRAAEHGERSILDGEPARFEDYGVTVSAPPRVRAVVGLVSLGQATRAAQSDAEAGPSGPTAERPSAAQLAGLGDFAPLRSTRACGGRGDAIRLEMTTAAARSVSPRHPIRVRIDELDLAADQTAMLIAADADGAVFPCGALHRADDENETDGSAPQAAEFVIDWLPDAPPETDAEGDPTRGLARTILLYLWRSLDWPTPSLGLKSARFVAAGGDVPTDPSETRVSVGSGEVRLRPVVAGAAAAGERIAVLVHGFQSDTRWMVGEVAAIAGAAGQPYDRIWTYDYESVGGSVRDSGQGLAAALGVAGLAAGDGVHVDIIAHSMGGLVSRAAIELCGAAALVDRCLTLGTPHHGTVLANLTRLAPLIGTVLVNAAGITPPGLVASWLMRRAERGAAGLADLRTDAAILSELAATAEPSDVAYRHIGGAVPELADAVQNRLKRALRQGRDQSLAALFGEPHDLVVGLSSQQNATAEGVHASEPLTLACTHFEYLSHPTARDAVAEWIAAGVAQPTGAAS